MQAGQRQAGGRTGGVANRAEVAPCTGAASTARIAVKAGVMVPGGSSLACPRSLADAVGCQEQMTSPPARAAQTKLRRGHRGASCSVNVSPFQRARRPRRSSCCCAGMLASLGHHMGAVPCKQQLVACCVSSAGRFAAAPWAPASTQRAGGGGGGGRAQSALASGHHRIGQSALAPIDAAQHSSSWPLVLRVGSTLELSEPWGPRCHTLPIAISSRVHVHPAA